MTIPFDAQKAREALEQRGATPTLDLARALEDTLRSLDFALAEIERLKEELETMFGHGILERTLADAHVALTRKNAALEAAAGALDAARNEIHAVESIHPSFLCEQTAVARDAAREEARSW